MSKTRAKSTANKAAYITAIPNTPLRFMAYISKPFFWSAFFVLFCVTVAQILSIYVSYIVKEMVDAIASAPDTVSAIDGLRYWGIIYILLTAFVYTGWRVSGIVGVYWLAGSKAYSFSRLYEYLSSHSYSYYANRFAGAVANKVSHASDGADNLLEQLTWHQYPGFLSVLGTCTLLFVTNFYIGLTFLCLVVLLFVVNAYLVRRRHPMMIAYAESSSVLRGIGVDLLTNIMAMKQYSRLAYERERMGRYVNDRTTKDIARDISQEIGRLITNIIVLLAMIGILVIAYVAFSRNLMSIGDVVLVVSLLWNTSYYLIFIGSMLDSFIRTHGEIQEGLEDVLQPYDIVDRPNSKTLKVKQGVVAWKNVTFEYDKNRVFDEFDLTIPAGQRVGLVGPSGAGKTTFVSLLLRQHDIDSGVIEIDGQDISKVTQDSLREQIAVVPQEPLLFHRSIRENIAYGKPDATDGEIIAVAKKAQAHDFIKSLPDGYHTLVGERGVKLSGGQKQRVAIARAMLKDAPILVLDEATSALDSESEVAIQQALHKLMAGKTVVAIAHRLSTLREMDRIIVLEGGKIVEDGSHDALVNFGGVYARLWKHQAGGFLQE